MLILERHLEIMKLLNTQGSTRVSALAKHFQVTEETIRRDLDKMEQEGKVLRSHGGAMSVERSGVELPHAHRERVHPKEKMAIAKEAVSRINEGDCIMLGASSTASYMAGNLPDIPLTVITHAIPIALALAEHQNIRVISIGGTLSRASLSFQGAMAQENLRQYQVDKLFISGQAFHSASGLSDDNEQHALLKKDMLAIANKRYLLMDSSKFETKALRLIGAVEAFDELITDDQAESTFLEALATQGLKATTVKA